MFRKLITTTTITPPIKTPIITTTTAYYSSKRIRTNNSINFESDNIDPIRRNRKNRNIEDEDDNGEEEEYEKSSKIKNENKSKGGDLFKKRSNNGAGILPKGLANNIIKNQWMKRQMTDPYVALAKKEQLISRAAFKLMNIDNDLKLFKSGQIVIDLGASPGGWSQYLRKVITQNGLVISVDILPQFELIDKLSFIQGDFTDPSTQLKIKRMIQHKSYTNLKQYITSNKISESIAQEQFQENKLINKLLSIENSEENNNDDYKVDSVVSDMAPSYSGIQQLDHTRLIQLQTIALEFSLKVLKKGGSFICKVSRGGEEKQFFKLLESNFLSVKSMKPEASRMESTEIYYIGKNFIGNIKKY